MQATSDQLARAAELAPKVAEGEGYLVTPCGKVISTKRGKVRFLQAWVNRKGYEVVELWAGGKGRKYTVHRLVALAFIGAPPSDRPHVNHKNGKKRDNRPENLEWCSQGDNVRHAWRTGLASPQAGTSHGAAKLTEEQVRAIRTRYADGWISQKSLGKEFGVSQTTVYDIVSGRKWGSLE